MNVNYQTTTEDATMSSEINLIALALCKAQQDILEEIKFKENGLEAAEFIEYILEEIEFNEKGLEAARDRLSKMKDRYRSLVEREYAIIDKSIYFVEKLKIMIENEKK